MRIFQKEDGTLTMGYTSFIIYIRIKRRSGSGRRKEENSKIKISKIAKTSDPLGKHNH